MVAPGCARCLDLTSCTLFEYRIMGIRKVSGSQEANVLVLTRRNNQSIMIGDDLEVKILGVSGEKVRIGISAPTDIPVYREEVFERMSSEEPKAGQGAGANGSTPD